MGPTGEAQGHGRFAARLDYLFRSVHPRGMNEYSYREVARELQERGVQISASYLHALRTGAKTDPRIGHVDALAKFFGVPASYFFSSDEEAESIEAQIALVAALRDTGVKDLALRATGLSDQGIRMVAQMIEQLREIEAGPE
jgi:transcriptional regulator with XRE-family HTH domain